jgi:hypothetical protein
MNGMGIFIYLSLYNNCIEIGAAPKSDTALCGSGSGFATLLLDVPQPPSPIALLENYSILDLKLLNEIHRGQKYHLIFNSKTLKK